jgi:hypothetical protein
VGQRQGHEGGELSAAIARAAVDDVLRIEQISVRSAEGAKSGALVSHEWRPDSGRGQTDILRFSAAGGPAIG